MFFKSLRFKITLWYVVLQIITLSTLGFALYRNLNVRLRSQMDNLLQLRAEGVADSIDTYWETELSMASVEGTGSRALNKSADPRFLALARRWVVERSDDPALLGIIVQIFGSTGDIITSSKNISSPVIPVVKAARDVLRGASRFEETASEDSAGRPLTMRMLTLPVIENNRTAYIVRVMRPMTSVFTALRDLRLMLFLLLPFAVVLSGLVGSLLARLSLAPVSRMVDTARDISADNLQLRIAAPESYDEMRKLAETFNAMLDRLESGFSSQRRFLDDLAHELKTPLSVMKGELEVTRKKVRSTETYLAALDSNLEEVDRLIRVVDDLLVLARLDQSVVALDWKPLDLGALVEDTVDSVGTLAERKGVALELSPGKTGQVLGDEHALKRLLLDIFDNAIKFTPAGGRVVVGLGCGLKGAWVTISDTGVGIPAEDLPHIFDRFFRASHSREAAGLGLGLSIAKSIADVHKGRIEVCSMAGEGSTFTVTLPSIRPAQSSG